MTLNIRARWKTVAITLLIAVGAFTQGVALAQSWPNKPLRIVVPYPVGGGLDPLARLIAAELTRQLGQQVVVDFRPGANGAIGTLAVVRAPADGHTLLIVPAPPVVHNKLLYKNLQYDPERDLTPIAKIGESPMVIVANPSVAAKNLSQLVALAKANPGKLSVAHVGTGSVAHLTDLLIERSTGIKLNVIPYATAQRMTDLLSGQIDLIADLPAAYLPHLQAGKLVGIAVMSAERNGAMPAVPTTAEAGFPDLRAEGWYGMYGPKDLPREIVARINKVVNDYLQSEEARRQFAQLGVAPTPTTPEGLQQYIAQEFAKWGPVIRDANLSLE